ncbi:alpha/beta hydrolase [Chitinivorax sp. B]|uniref:alpha/beta fold hydrolase n=1 Tax=Chitinivorax sp. B TaxID=2502235 RepID=UPI0010F4C45A|nr:alpha/beta hydrolase [Chitinivorax sp. B]
MLTLVLLPGLDGTATLFEPLLPYLPPHVRICPIHYPPEQTLGYSALVALVKQALPRHGPYVVLGESFSGPVAIQLAAQADQHMVGLILCCSFACSPRPSLIGLRPLIGLTPIRWLPSRLLAMLLYGRGAHVQLRKLLEKALAQVAQRVLQHRLQAVLDVDVLPDWQRIALPVCYLQATHDLLIPASQVSLLKTMLPSMQVSPLAGPHGLLQASPVAAAIAIRHFLSTLESRSVIDDCDQQVSPA